MKTYLLPLLLAATASLTSLSALAQDKPALNTTPPGPPPAPARIVEPAPAPVPDPTPATEIAPAPGVPGAQPTSTAPSGLDFPNRAATKAGGAEDEPATKKFLYTNFGLGYSSYDYLNRFNFSLAPAIGFRITDKFAIGPGISYAYSSYSVSGNRGYPYTPDGSLTTSGASNISTSSLGFKGFAQYIVYNEFFIHAEYEVTNAQIIYEGSQHYLFKQSRKVATPLAGIGYRTVLGDKAAFDIVGLYNFDSSIYSLYPGLVVRFSLLFDIGK